MSELARLFPTEIAADTQWTAANDQVPQGQAKPRKHAVVKVTRSVYAVIPGRNKYRPRQSTSMPNFTLSVDWKGQKYAGRM